MEEYLKSLYGKYHTPVTATPKVTTGSDWGGLSDYLAGQSLGDYVSLAGTAGSLYSNFLGDGKKLARLQLDHLNEQVGMLKEQRAANQEALQNKRTFNSTWANASNKGLAASAVNGQFS